MKYTIDDIHHEHLQTVRVEVNNNYFATWFRLRRQFAASMFQARVYGWWWLDENYTDDDYIWKIMWETEIREQSMRKQWTNENSIVILFSILYWIEWVQTIVSNRTIWLKAQITKQKFQQNNAKQSMTRILMV